MDKIIEYIINWWNSTFNFSNPEAIYRSITNIILIVFSFLLLYRSLYTFIGFFMKGRRYKDAPMDKRYACVISARNEEKVIGNLIESIKKQTYNQDLIQIFVVADNCTDKTAQICRDLGAIVYERFDDKHVSKGYALEFLFDHIAEDYGVLSNDYYLVFDADNLLKRDFIEQMNKGFHEGYDALTSFRNIKNFDTNLISAGYGIHFYRKPLIANRARSILNVSTNVTGTGYGIKACHLVNGWHYTSLTEDAEFSADAISNNLKIGYCEEAEIYDEQPTALKVAFKQRLRWRRGGLQAFVKRSPKLFVNFFKTGKFSSYDMYFELFPYDLFSFIMALLVQLFGMFYSLFTTGHYNILIFLKYLGNFFLGAYIGSIGIGLLVMIKERKRLKCSFWRKVLYLITWPWFDIVSIPIALVAIFKHVTWKPITHNDAKTIEDIEKKNL